MYVSSSIRGGTSTSVASYIRSRKSAVSGRASSVRLSLGIGEKLVKFARWDEESANLRPELRNFARAVGFFVCDCRVRIPACDAVLVVRAIAHSPFYELRVP